MAEASGTMGATPKAPGAQAAAPSDPTKTAGSTKVSAPFRITTLQDADRWFKGLFYAAHGVGKTELACSAVDCEPMRDVLWIDAESGNMTVYDSTRIKHWDQIRRIRVTDFETITKIQVWLKAYCAARDSNNVPQMRKLWTMVTGEDLENPPIFRTCIVDSLTEVEAYCTYQILKIDTTDIAKELASDIDVAGWPEFRKNFEMVKLLVRAFRDLPMHVIFCAAASYSQDERKRQLWAPMLTGKLGSQVQGFVDMVGYIVTGPINADTGVAPRRMYIQPSGDSGVRYDAKNRRSVFTKSYMDNPTMSSIMNDIGLIKT